MAEGTCKVFDCERVGTLRRGFCNRHYQILRRHGDPLHAAPRADPICSIRGCDRSHVARGWCSRHYEKWRVHGDPLYGVVCLVEGCDSPSLTRGWCIKHYNRWRRYGDPLLTKTIKGDTPARFESRLALGVEPAHAPDLGPCWLWTAHVNDDGYGVLKVEGRTRPAHIWSYEYHVGEVPTGLELDHLCRVRACVNPWHLDPVTHAENVRRAVAA